MSPGGTMQRRWVRILLVVLLVASLMPSGQTSSTLHVDSYVAFGSIVRVTVTNSNASAQTAILVVMVELANGLSDISVQPITVSGMTSVSKSSVFSNPVTRIIFVGISEGPDPVNFGRN